MCHLQFTALIVTGIEQTSYFRQPESDCMVSLHGRSHYLTGVTLDAVAIGQVALDLFQIIDRLNIDGQERRNLQIEFGHPLELFGITEGVDFDLGTVGMKLSGHDEAITTIIAQTAKYNGSDRSLHCWFWLLPEKPPFPHFPSITLP